VSARRLWTIVCALGLALGIAACGQTADPPSLLNDGVYVITGHVTYQMQVSRELNPYGVEDSQYLVGLPSGDTPTGLTADQLWYGVFLWAKNQTSEPRTTATRFEIIDSSGDVYHPVALDSSVNQYAWTTQVLAPGAIAPGPSTTASNGPTGGSLLLFKLPTTVYSNRPLTLWIYPHGGGTPAQIALDL
jgi:hypothetical protein